VTQLEDVPTVTVQRFWRCGAEGELGKVNRHLDAVRQDRIRWQSHVLEDAFDSNVPVNVGFEDEGRGPVGFNDPAQSQNRLRQPRLNAAVVGCIERARGIHAVAVAVLDRSSNFGGFLRVVGWLDCEVAAVDLVSSFFGFFFGTFSFAFGGDGDLGV
jgi:hypothetical protein